MKNWDREVQYYGPEQNAYQILKVMKAFAQHYIDHGVEPPRKLFQDLHYHDAWLRLRDVSAEYIWHQNSLAYTSV